MARKMEIVLRLTDGATMDVSRGQWRTANVAMARKGRDFDRIERAPGARFYYVGTCVFRVTLSKTEAGA